MVELIRYLEANGFTVYIASGGDRDFMRPIAAGLYGVPPERVIGSSSSDDYREDDAGTDVLYKARMEFLDDGPTKPVRIWTTGSRCSTTDRLSRMAGLAARSKHRVEGARWAAHQRRRRSKRSLPPMSCHILTKLASPASTRRRTNWPPAR